MDYPIIRVMATGGDPDSDTPVADITLPYPDNAGGVLSPITATSEEETLDFTRFKEITGAKVRYVLSFSFMPVTLYNELLTYLVLSTTARDIYFKYERWSQSSDYVKVLANVGRQDVANGLDDVSTDIELTEVNSRI